MFTENGFKKPAFYAFSFLNKLGNIVIAKGNNYIVTKKKKQIVILFFNYAHYSNTYAEEVGINTNYKSRYNVIPNKKKISITLTLPFLDGDFEISRQIYNQDNGSVYDIFLKIGDLSYLSSDEIQYIKNRATPTLSKEIITGFPLKFSTILEPLEIQLVEIKHIQTILNK